MTDDHAEEVARAFHEAYERLAPEFGYKTREASAKPWSEVPEQNRRLMMAVVQELDDYFATERVFGRQMLLANGRTLVVRVKSGERALTIWSQAEPAQREDRLQQPVYTINAGVSPESVKSFVAQMALQMGVAPNSQEEQAVHRLIRAALRSLPL